MKTLVISKPHKIELVQRSRPPAGKGEILLRLRYVGFCGSDLSSYLGKNPLVEYPRVPGHEICASIEETGAAVPRGFSPGENVTVVPYTSCGQCTSCRNGRTNACQFNQTLGVQRDGAMRQYLALPWEKIVRAPRLDELSLVVVEPLTVGFHAMERGCVGNSDLVLVLGCGMIGSGAIAGAVLRGATVIAADIDDYKLDIARELGAQYTVNTKESVLADEISGISGRGPDVVVEAAGNPVTYRAAVELVAFTGRVVCIGYSDKEVEFSTKLFVQKEIDIMGSRNATMEDFRSVIACLEQGIIPVKRLITRIIKPEEAGNAIEQWAGEPGKVMKIILDMG